MPQELPQTQYVPGSGRVFVPQEPTRRDPETGALAAMYDLSLALEYGRLVKLLPTAQVMLDMTPTIDHLRNCLRDFCDNDHVLCIGSPVAIAATCMVASEINYGRVKVLQYLKRQQAYVSYQIDVPLERG